jgi:tetratricopeptide (TPR) repeat protein
LLTLVFMVLLPGPAFGRESVPALQSTLSEAERYFREASDLSEGDSAQSERLFRKALVRYTFIVEQGKVKNSKLFYNIGNTYFRLRDFGRAILWYRRADLLDRGNGDIIRNLDVARRTGGITAPVSSASFFSRAIDSFHAAISFRTRYWLFTILFGTFWVFGAAAVISRRSFGWATAMTATVALLFAASVLFDSWHRASFREVVVIVKDAVAREGDGRGYTPLFNTPLHAGMELKLISSRHEWVELQFPDGRKGWLPAAAVEVI